MKSLILIALALATQQVSAHEGHDHGPSAVQAPKGGVLRSLETVHVELVSEKNKALIRVYDMKLKPQPVKNFPASATIQLPRKKAEAVMLEDKGDHWVAAVDAKGAHRYTLELTIKQGGHDDKLKFTVEPRK